MEVVLDAPLVRRITVCAAILLAIYLVSEATRFWLADRLIHSNNLPAMERGASMFPGNGEAWDLVGRFKQTDFATSNPASAVDDFRRAVEADPRSSYDWMDLASGCELAGNIGEARNAYLRAKSVYPISAFVAWNYGNFLLRQQQYPEALAEIKSAVTSDPKLAAVAISRVWRSTGDVNQLADSALPSDPDVYLQALDFFQSIQNAKPGMVIWKKIVALRPALDISRTFPFLQELIR